MGEKGRAPTLLELQPTLCLGPASPISAEAMQVEETHPGLILALPNYFVAYTVVSKKLRADFSPQALELVGMFGSSKTRFLKSSFMAHSAAVYKAVCELSSGPESSR